MPSTIKGFNLNPNLKITLPVSKADTTRRLATGAVLATAALTATYFAQKYFAPKSAPMSYPTLNSEPTCAPVCGKPPIQPTTPIDFSAIAQRIAKALFPSTAIKNIIDLATKAPAQALIVHPTANQEPIHPQRVQTIELPLDTTTRRTTNSDGIGELAFRNATKPNMEDLQTRLSSYFYKLFSSALNTVTNTTPICGKPPIQPTTPIDFSAIAQRIAKALFPSTAIQNIIDLATKAPAQALIVHPTANQKPIHPQRVQTTELPLDTTTRRTTNSDGIDEFAFRSATKPNMEDLQTRQSSYFYELFSSALNTVTNTTLIGVAHLTGAAHGAVNLGYRLADNAPTIAAVVQERAESYFIAVKSLAGLAANGAVNLGYRSADNALTTIKNLPSNCYSAANFLLETLDPFSCKNIGNIRRQTDTSRNEWRARGCDRHSNV